MMDDLLDFILDLFGEIPVWEQMNRYLRKKIPIRPLRWLVVSLIYMLILVVIIVIFAGVTALFT